MLKIGDKVRAKVSAKSDLSGEYYYKKGWVGTVVSLYQGTHYYVDWTENPDFWIDGHWYIPIEAAEPA